MSHRRHVPAGCDQDRYVKSCPTLNKSGILPTKFGHKLLLSLSAQHDYVKELKKIIARTHCFMHQFFFRPNYIFNNDAYFLDFRAQKFPLIFFNVNLF